MNTLKGVRRIAVALTTAVAVIIPTLPAQAAGSDAGLYGAADPAYDGVFRQSLAIMGLAANDMAPPKAAISWLLDQQCADGSFEAYRADTGRPCGKPDPVNFTGPDTNSTALALMALMSLDDSRVMNLKAPIMDDIVDAADKAGQWLLKQQNADGGWPYYAGSASDANSTGIALAGIMTQAPNTKVAPYRKASRFLGTLASSCAAGGGFAYQAGSKPDGSATAQGTIGLTGGLPVSKQPAATIAAPCKNTAKAKGVSYLATALAAKGVLDSSIGGADYTSTSMAVLALATARQGRTAIAKGIRTLKANAQSWATPSTGTSPGATGLLLMVAEVAGTKPTNFGGLNLVTTLNNSLRK